MRQVQVRVEVCPWLPGAVKTGLRIGQILILEFLQVRFGKVQMRVVTFGHEPAHNLTLWAVDDGFPAGRVLTPRWVADGEMIQLCVLRR